MFREIRAHAGWRRNAFVREAQSRGYAVSRTHLVAFELGTRYISVETAEIFAAALADILDRDITVADFTPPGAGTSDVPIGA